jgi:tetratricopeptide (TPR) repeat protein
MVDVYRFLGKYVLEPSVGATSVYLKSQRMTWLLLYLATKGTWVSRKELQLLFWEDSPNSAQGLRQLLYRTKQLGLETTLEVNKHSLRFVADNDIQQFVTAYKEQRFNDAYQWYQGELGAESTNFDEVPEFEAWLDLERSGLRHSFIDTAQKYAASLNHDPETALNILERALQEDKLNEGVLEQILQLADKTGLLQRGLTALQGFALRLKAEIGLEISSNLEQWRGHFQQRLNVTLAATQATQTTQKPTSSYLPKVLTPLLGRESELEALQNLDARVITLLGIGGIGKSRLAFEYARLRGIQTFFVSLSSVQTERDLVAFVAQTIGLQLPGLTSPDLELRQALSDMDSPICLVLDNVEQVVTQTVSLLETLLQIPTLQVLVTSRTRLNILGEHVFMVQGLPFPSASDNSNLEQFASVRLVLTAAHRNGSAFQNTPENLEAIAAITRSIQGVPLALELAAAWLRILSPSEVATELHKSWSLLEETTLQLPPRQSGLKAVFDSTWALLTSHQQTVLAGLAFFRGGFDFAAAKDVLNADHRTMLQLMDWALVKRLENGRYDLHPLIREYAGANLLTREATLEAFNAYFMRLAKQSYLLAPQTFDEDVENMMIVWQAALNAQDDSTLEAFNHAFFEVLFRLGRFPELQHQIQNALQISLKSQNLRLTSILRAWRIEVHHNIGHAGQLEDDLEQVIQDLEAQHLQFELAMLHHNLGLKARDAAQYLEALHHLEQSLNYGKQIPYPYWETVVLRNIALVYDKQNNRRAARKILTDMLEFEAVRNDGNSLAGIRNSLGELECRENNWEAAQEHFVKAEQYARITKSIKVHAWTLENLGRLALRNQDIDAALNYLNAALGLFRNVGDVLWVARVRCVLADAYNANGQTEMARLERLKGLRTAQELGAVSVIRRCLRAWLPQLHLEQPTLAATLQKNLEKDNILQKHLPDLITYLERADLQRVS